VDIFNQYGYPEKILSDNGTQFTSTEFEEFCERSDILHLKSAPFHQQANGKAERMIQTIKKYLKKGANLTKTLQVMRDTPRSADEPSPYQQMFSRKMRTPLRPSPLNLQKVESYLEDVRIEFSSEEKESVYKGKAKDVDKTHERKNPYFKVGDIVYFQKANKGKWTPGQITEVVPYTGHNQYKVLEDSTGATYRRDRSMIKLSRNYVPPVDPNPTNASRDRSVNQNGKAPVSMCQTKPTQLRRSARIQQRNQ